MTPYKNLSGQSNVIAYEHDPSSIKVEFRDYSLYLYTVASCGAIHINAMIQCADQGYGLNSYINKNVKKAYAAKLR